MDNPTTDQIKEPLDVILATLDQHVGTHDFRVALRRAIVQERAAWVRHARERVLAAEEAAGLKLAAIDVCALSNTPLTRDSARITDEHPAYTAAYTSVASAVDREILYRDALVQILGLMSTHPHAPKGGGSRPRIISGWLSSLRARRARSRNSRIYQLTSSALGPRGGESTDNAQTPTALLLQAQLDAAAVPE